MRSDSFWEVGWIKFVAHNPPAKVCPVRGAKVFTGHTQIYMMRAKRRRGAENEGHLHCLTGEWPTD
jgi:hypothetical protein